jgi:hypothetical protein
VSIECTHDGDKSAERVLRERLWRWWSE